MKNKRLKIALTFTITVIFFISFANLISSSNLNSSILSMPYENDSYTMEIRGTLNLDAEVYYGTSAVATITLNEELYNFDEGANDTAWIFVNSSSDSIGIIIDLIETGYNTSIFIGNFTFSTVESNYTLGIILVQNGDTIVAHDNVSLSDSATWLESASKTIELDATTYYGVSAIANITVFDTSYNLNPTILDIVNVSVNSSTDITGISVQLTETGVNTSYFTGFFTFSTIVSNDPADIIWAQDGDTIMAIHDNVTDTATWVETVTGTIILDEVQYYGTAAIAVIAVSDSDLDITGAPDSVGVDVYSTSDIVGINVQLIETGPTTGVFMGTFTFSTTASNDPLDIILALDGDIITTRYNDSHTVTGMPAQTLDSAIWIATVTGTIDLDSPTYVGSGAIATITVVDSDLDVTGAMDYVDVNVNSTSDPTGIVVRLDETGATTGIFIGSFTFNNTSSNDAADIIWAQDGDTIMSMYNDSHTITGAFAQPKDTAIWIDTVTITLDLDSTYYYGTAAIATITVIDSSYNLNSTIIENVNVTVNSTSDNPGIMVQLFETAVNSAIFSGTFTFSTTSSNDPLDIIWAQDGDTIMVIHDSLNDTAIWIETVTGIVNLDSATYYGTDAVANIMLNDSDLDISASPDNATVLVNSSSDVGGIYVQLTEIGSTTGIFMGNFTFSSNFSSDLLDIIRAQDGDIIMVIYNDLYDVTGASAQMVDTATWIETVTGSITLDSTAYYGTGTVAMITVIDSDLDTTGGNDYVDVNVNSSSDNSGIIVQLGETGPTTGIFTGNFTFSTSSSNDPSDIILVQVGDTVMVIYNDTHTITGESARVLDIATWDTDSINPSIVLDSPQNETVLNKPAFIYLTITDDNLDISTVEWRANVTQLTWTNSFVGSFDIDLSSFNSDQVVQFWIRANDTFGNQNITTIILTFDDTPPTKPTYKSVIIQSGNITISWFPSADNNSVNYIIRRDGEYLGITSLTYYMDLNASKKKYTYEIIPVDEANNTGESLIIKIKIKGPFRIPWIPPPNNTITIIIIIIGIVGASAGTVGVIVIRKRQTSTQQKISKQKLAKKKKKIDSLAPRMEHKKDSSANLEFLLNRLKKEKYLTDLKRDISFLSEDEVIRILKLNIPDNAEKATILKELASLSPKEREEFLRYLENIK